MAPDIPITNNLDSHPARGKKNENNRFKNTGFFD
jgi:hypothetical protein